MALIKCIHNNYLAGVSELADIISIRCKYEKIPRIKYQDRCIILRSCISFSNPINPYCSRCMADIITKFIFSGRPPQDACRLLEHLCGKVMEKEKEIDEESGSISGVIDVDVQVYNDFICADLEELEHYLSDAWVQGLLPDDMNVYFEYTPRFNPAAKSAVDELERVDSNTTKEDSCVVCLEGIKEGMVVRMPCKHEFHENCIVEWLSSSHICPLCRFELPPEVSN